MEPKITIGIISRNRAKILPLAIKSAQAQTYGNKEVMVLDDASTDNTRDLQADYPAITWIFEPAQNGIALGRNKLMVSCNADYFCSLDDDAWFLSGEELKIAVEFMESHSDVAALAFDILSPDKPEKNEITAPEETNMYIGCGHLLRLSVLRDIGFYHVFPGFYGGEEKDLCIRLMDGGYKIFKLPGIHVWHDKTTIARDLAKQHRSGVCNDLIFTFRCTPSFYLPIALLNKLFKHLRFSFAYKPVNLRYPCLLAFYDFFGLLIAMKLTRSPVSINTLKKYYSFNKY